MRFCRVIVGVLLIASSGIARGDDVTAAKMHYERGTTLFDLQRYLEAAKEYEAAFEAKSDPALLFNIAQAYRLGADYGKAIAAYKSYLRRVPDADNRAEIEGRIAELQRLSDEQKLHQETPPSGAIKPGENEAHPARAPEKAAAVPLSLGARPTSPSAERPSRTKLIVGVAVGAAGLAAIAVGGIFEGLASSIDNRLTHPPMGSTFDPTKEQSLKTDETVGAVMLAVGGAALVAGTIWAVLGVREHRQSRVAVAPVFSTDRMGVVVDARF